MERRFAERYRLLALNIAYYRKVNGLSQMELAEKVDISRTHMSRIENGDSAVSLDTIFSISEALQVPVDKLFSVK